MNQVSRRSHVVVYALVSAALAGALASACQKSPDTITLSESDNGRSVVAAVGDRIEVALHVVGPFYFGSPAISSGAVRLVRQSDELPSQPNPGGGKTQRYVFEAAAPGRADVSIPRELPVPEPPVFRISVQVY